MSGPEIKWAVTISDQERIFINSAHLRLANLPYIGELTVFKKSASYAVWRPHKILTKPLETSHRLGRHESSVRKCMAQPLLLTGKALSWCFYQRLSKQRLCFSVATSIYRRAMGRTAFDHRLPHTSAACMIGSKHCYNT